MELDKCPFCGSDNTGKTSRGNKYLSHKESCYLGFTTSFISEKDIDDWNTRISPWIRCENGLPEKEGRYFILYKYGNIPEVKAFINEYYPIEKRWANVLDNITIIAWMPIPEFKED